METQPKNANSVHELHLFGHELSGAALSRRNLRLLLLSKEKSVEVASHFLFLIQLISYDRPECRSDELLLLIVVELFVEVFNVVSKVEIVWQGSHLDNIKRKVEQCADLD